MPNERSIVFHQWSRKGYAIFAGLGRHIIIAVLAVPVCYSSMLKTVVLTEATAYTSCSDCRTESDDGSPTMPAEMMEIISVASTDDEVAAAPDIVNQHFLNTLKQRLQGDPWVFVQPLLRYKLMKYKLLW